MLINTQALRRLVLSYCSLDWDLLTHRNLTHLRLFSIKPGTLPTLAKLMENLGKMTALESLVLVEALIRAGPACPSGEPKKNCIYIPTSRRLSRHCFVPSHFLVVLKLTPEHAAVERKTFCSSLPLLLGHTPKHPMRAYTEHLES